MTYEGQFRDFMVGWIASQLEQPEHNRKDLEALYNTVIDADSDVGALSEIEAMMGESATVLAPQLRKKLTLNLLSLPR